MDIIYKAIFKYNKDKNELNLTRVLPDCSQDTSPINLDEINSIEKTCRDFGWNKSENLSRQIGEKLFNIINGDRQTLVRALKEADDYGEYLQLHISPDGPTSNLPFELLYYNNFLVPLKIHLIRRVSDWGIKKELKPKNRPLKVLFMACSPEGLSPVLEFEKEEDMIYKVTEDLPIDIDVEDTGSLEGLGECLTKNQYDIVHLSGHADINQNGIPFFWMEDEEGFPMQVTPSELWETLNLNPPRLLFLSGCRTGEAPEHLAAVSFAHHLVTNHCSTVLGWGLPVSDEGAAFAAKQLYFEISRGKDIFYSVSSTRQELFKKHKKDWSILRLFSDGSSLTIPLVETGQRKQPKKRELQHTYLHNSQVKILTEGFIGRRRQIQQGLKSLKKDKEKVGLLLYGTGGLGKSCLAGKFCEKFKYHTLIIIHGPINAVTMTESLKDAFIRSNDEKSLKIIQESLELPDKIRILCSSSFQERNYLILLDDFEKNLINAEVGKPEISLESVEIFETLLKYLSYSGKMSQFIITSRYIFPLTVDGVNLIDSKLECIGLTSFRDADELKKVTELDQIANYPKPEIRQYLIMAGRGNPRLMEAINTLLKEVKDIDIVHLLSSVKDKQEEFIQGLLLRKILETQSEDFQNFLRKSAVYRLPVLKEGIKLVCEDIKNWESYINKAVSLSLMEKDTSRIDYYLYWVTPLLRESVFKELKDEDRKKCNQSAVSYYQSVLSQSKDYIPIIAIELIEHSLQAGMDDIAIEEVGSRLLPYLRNSLAYNEALSIGNSIISRIHKKERNENYARLLYELGWIYQDTGNARKAIDYYEQSLSINNEIYSYRHSSVASNLNTLGLAWRDLGDTKKAIEYIEQALSIYREVYGNKHPDVARALNNLGLAWKDLGDTKKAIDYYDQALSIVKVEYGNKHPYVAKTLNNLGTAWRDLGDAKKAIEYFEQALSIGKEIYGEKHPSIATKLNNLGGAWRALGNAKKAIEYFEQALSIVKEVYGNKHPYVATSLNNLGLAWSDLGDVKKAIEYFDQALSIFKEVYGNKHPDVAATLNNLGTAWSDLGETKKAIEYLAQALSIVKELYSNKHPHVVNILNNLGYVWSNLGDLKKAIEYYEQALSIVKEVYGNKHPDVAATLNNLGTAWSDLGETKKAIEYLEQALFVDKEIYGEKHPNVARDLNNLGAAWSDLGDVKRAIEYFEQAYSIFREIYGDEHPSTKTIKEWLDIIKKKKE